MKKLATLVLLATSIAFANAQGNWSVDNAHTNVKFSVPHMGISEVEGSFKIFSGSVNATTEDFTNAQIEFSIDVNSINTDNENRDNHLKSDDFFNAAQYPKISFKSTSFKKISGNKYELEGNLTIRDVTKKVKLNVVYNGKLKNPKGGETAGFKITGLINRFDYNLKWNSLIEATPVVGKDVTLVVNLELKKQ